MQRIELPLNNRYDFKRMLSFHTLICVAVTVALVLIFVFCFRNSLYRLGQSLSDFGNSFAYNFLESIGADHNIKPTVNDYNFGLPQNSAGDSPVKIPSVLIPESFDSYKVKLSLYLVSLNGENLQYFVYLALSNLRLIISIVMFIAILLIAFNLYFEVYLTNANNNYDRISRPMKIWNVTYKNVVLPLRRHLSEFVIFVRDTKIFKVVWIFLALVASNVLSILISGVAWLYYLFGSFDIVSIYRQIYKLFVDLSPTFNYIGLFLVVILSAWYCYHKSFRTADNNIRWLDSLNDKIFVKFGICLMIVGPMGTGKTTLMTYLAIKSNNRFRNKALELMHNIHSEFPSFPWLKFELELKARIADRTVYDLRSISRYISACSSAFAAGETDCYGYDYRTHGLYYNNGNDLVYLYCDLDEYARLYLIYTLATTFLISNYSIRDDGYILDKNNFPLFDGDFFSRDEYSIAGSTYAHIFDMDMFRLGRKLLENNPHSNLLEFGVISMTEIAKDRGNQNELKELKKNAEETNQKNDLFAYRLQLARHFATVRNFPFFLFYSDDQRPGALSATFTQLAEIVYIDSVSDKKNTLPCFGILRSIHDKLYAWLLNKYDKYRFNRGDTTLLIRALSCVVFKLHSLHERAYNRYGYKQLALRFQNGLTGEMSEPFDFFLCFKAIYSSRFATDCYAELLNVENALGLQDLPSYQSLYPTRDEFRAQHSFFINSLIDMFDDNN